MAECIFEDRGRFKVYAQCYPHDPQFFTWIGQGLAESTAPIAEAVHGPFASLAEAIADAQLVHPER
jgi:hypothetical protein